MPSASRPRNCSRPASTTATDLSGWKIDLRLLYDETLWVKRAEFHMMEWLYEPPDASCAVVLYAIGEIGLNRQVGALALFRDKTAPRLVWQSERLPLGVRRPLFWFEGQPGEPVVFETDLFEHAVRARLFEYHEPKGGGLGCRERVLDLVSGGLFPA